MNHSRSLFVASLAVSVLFASPARADNAKSSANRPAAPSATAELAALLAAFDAAPTSEAMTRLVSLPLVRVSPDAAFRVVDRICRGGRPSTDAFVELASHSDGEVRATALRGIAQAGIRTNAAVKVMRKGAVDYSPVVRDAARIAVTRIGDSKDVDALIADLDNADPKAIRSAHFGLVALTGLKIQPLKGPWAYWWSDAKVTLPKRLAVALKMLDTGGDPGDLADARLLVESSGWCDVDAVSDAARGWLHLRDPRRRLVGYRVAVALRLGELAGDVEGAFRYEFNPAIWAQAREAAVALGCSTDGVTPPEGVPEQDRPLPTTPPARTPASAVPARVATR